MLCSRGERERERERCEKALRADREGREADLCLIVGELEVISRL